MPESRIVDNVNSVSKFREAAESALYRKVGEHISIAKETAAHEIVTPLSKDKE